MAVVIVRNGVALTNAFGFVITNGIHAPRFKTGNMVAVDTDPPTIGDEVFCETEDGRVFIGFLKSRGENGIVLSDSCRVVPEPDITLAPVSCWRVTGCYFGRVARDARDFGEVAA